MSQNTSSAVMQQRSEPQASLDDFPTPPWATRAICRRLMDYTPRPLGDLIARDPCANRGHMVRPLQEHFAQVYAADVHDYGAGFAQADFLFPGPLHKVDWTFINPPFKLAEEFIERAIETSLAGVVCIARTSFLEGEGRAAGIFARHRPSHVYQFAERVVMLRGRLVQTGKPDPMNLDDDDEPRKASTATSYAALVWHLARDNRTTLFDWILPCRRDFEVPGDYPEHPQGLAKLYRRAIW
jgi:hypothetical protein